MDVDEKLLLRLVEAIIFASDNPVKESEVKESLKQLELPARTNIEDRVVSALLHDLSTSYRGRGVNLVKVATGWQFRTAADLSLYLQKILAKPRSLGRAPLEVLAVIAYHQPVTRAEMEHIRGVNLSQRTLEILLEEKLITTDGYKPIPGRPALWVTTPQFLVTFGLNSLEELPTREDLLSDSHYFLSKKL